MANLDKDYDSWHRKVYGSDLLTDLHLSQWHYDALTLSPPMADATVLEVGCGPGDFAIHLSRQAKGVSAVDFSSTAVEIARKKSAAQEATVAFQVADAQNLPFKDDSFDLLFSCECLEHLPDPQKALREMHRVLREGGTLVLTTENYSNAMLITWAMCWLSGRPFNSGSGTQPHENFFLFWRVRKMMARADFRVCEMKGAHHVFFVLPGCHPHLFVRERFHSPVLAALFKPFARHVTFKAVKP